MSELTQGAPDVRTGAVHEPSPAADRAASVNRRGTLSRQLTALARVPPRLVASWARAAAGLTALEAGALAIEALVGEREAARRALPGTAVSLAVMHADTFVHLRSNAATREGEPFETIGLPVVLTLLRRTIAGFLWAHLLGGRPLASRPALAALLVAGSASDVADGALARRAGRVTRLGAYLDAEADFSFWTALVLTLGARGLLPRWLIALLFARFGAPAGFAAISQRALRRPVPVGSTIAGKAAAVAQLAVCATALRPRRHSEAGDPLAERLLHALAACLLVAAPLAQARRIFGPLARHPREAYSAAQSGQLPVIHLS